MREGGGEKEKKKIWAPREEREEAQASPPRSPPRTPKEPKVDESKEPKVDKSTPLTMGLKLQTAKSGEDDTGEAQWSPRLPPPSSRGANRSPRNSQTAAPVARAPP